MIWGRMLRSAWASVVWQLLVLGFLLALGSAQAATAGEFDHLRTGFGLTGAHNVTRCENCHIGGVFKGTPRDCESCHTGGARYARTNTVKSADHLPTQQACDLCHSTHSFTAARMNHAGVAAGSCLNCHNGVQASGKPAGHFVTPASCDSCHRSAGWRPVSGFAHAGVAPGSCTSCHNGQKASGKSAAHAPYQSVVGLSAANCDSCHKTSNVSWTAVKLHTSVTVSAQCATCHATGKPNTAVHNGPSVCENCHKSTSSWAEAKVDHNVVSTNCASCHNGSGASGSGATHIPIGTTNCDSCHSTSSWKPTQWNHTQLTVANQCASCHTGGYPPAAGKSATHTPYQTVAALTAANCDSCHKAGNGAKWTPAKLHAGVTVTAQCATCHAATKPTTAVHTGQTVCENCHKSTSTWQGAKVDHSGFTTATNCASCHNGSGATGKSATHIPAGTTNCIACHNTTAWKPSSWNHTQLTVTNQCASCHTGAFPPADGKSSTHTPYQSVASLASANCDSCHKAGYAAWTPAKLHAGVTVTAQCATCHAATKPTTAVHTGQTVCENCHKSTSTWSGAKIDHSTFTAATNCASCHNGTGATGKSATHIPAGTTNCIACHNTTAWKPSSWNHTQLTVTNQCASCHTGAFPPADGKSSTHTPYQSVASLASANCDSCHKAGYAAWTPAKLHASVTVTAQCATCHAATKPTTAVHTGQTVCENCHKSTSTWAGAKVDHSGFTTATNCASCHDGSGATGKSATHIPVAATNCIACHNTTAWKPSSWNHTQLTVTNQCASCHTGAFPPADGKSSTHTPYQSVASLATANCDSCHKAGYAAWTPAKLHASVTVTAQCATCHAATKPTTAVHTGQTVCENCHKSTSTWAGAKVDHSGFTTATNCASCHDGSGATGKSATHIPAGTTNCIACHNTTAWKPSSWNHTQLTVTNQCASCHTGAFPPADGKSASHTPYQSVASLAAANCDSCHKAGYAAWTPAKLHASVTVTAQCATCHAATKPTTAVHTGQTVCENCHKSTSTWAGAKVDHSGFTTATNCASCHDGSGATGKSATHIPAGTTNCIACHNTTAWKPSSWNHTQLTVANQCASCHTGAFPPADGKSSTHTPYQSVAALASANCDSCHKAGYAAWTPAKLHAGVTVTAQCATCHAATKPTTAVHTGQTVCENCHKSTSTWAGAKVDHSGFTTATNCASCHNGSGATGKSATHIPAGTTNCIACHNTTAWKPSSWNHTQLTVTNQCASCHTGAFPPADGKSSTHTPYQSVAALASANCDSCHKAGYAAWTPAKLHAGVTVTAQCATCHAATKPTTAVHTGQTVCENCHKSTSTWAGAKVDHSGFTTATNCASCHDGSGATGKSATHIPVAATNCIACHNTTAWKPSSWNHTQLTVTNQCASCHTGAFPPADGKSSTHTPYQSVASLASANCDSCHKAGYAAWTPAKLHASVTVTAQCATCHAATKPTTAVHTGQTVCENCHKSTSTWQGAKVDHSGFTTATNCASCHNGSGATGKSATHIPAGTTNCIACHNTTAWKPSSWNHTQLTVTNQCASCHTGAFPPADGKSASHTPYQSVASLAAANCDSCHKAGYAAWTPAKLHASVTVTAQCATCHAAIKPTTAVHTGQTVCENCHKSTSTWSGAKIDHSTFTAATNCASCHNGSGATGKSATHIPAGTTNCIACHNTTAWKPSSWNHTQLTVTNQCASCHTGAFPPADGKSSTHTPYQSVASLAAANCDSCHKAGYAAWTPAKLHASVTVTAQCATCHAATKPTTAVHTGQTVCENCHKSTSTWSGAKVDHSGFTTATNCASCHDGSGATGKSATHIPAGTTNCIACHNTTAWKPSSWNHTQLTVTNQCASCHTGAFPPADGKSASHTPYQSVASLAAANCDSCHKAGYAAWTPAKLHASVTVTAQCATCHAAIKPTTAVHTGQTVCENCHKSTSTWSGAKIDHSTFTAATNCASCHNGSGATGKSATHIPAGTTNCIACHNTTAWKPSSWNHTQLTVTNQCASCHTGAFPPADGKSSTHTPYQSVASLASANCDSCHKAGYAAWTPAKLHASVTVTAQCATCHAATKPTTAVHTGQTVCENCHKSTSTWAGAKVDHSGFTTATNCASCHDGSGATGKSATHIPVAATNCIACHNTTAWKPSSWNHTQLTVTNQCASCHTGAFPPADGKSSTHTPYQSVASLATANCDSCHKAGYAAWTPAKLHASVTVTAQCATCHAATKPTTAVHTGQTVCENCHKSTSTWAGAKVDHSGFTTATNCASCHDGSGATGKSATHIPAGTTNCIACHNTTAWKPSSWNHTQLTVTNQCASCHTGAFPPADGKSASHTPYQSVASLAAANCDSCHKAGYAAWTPAKLHASVTVTAQCATCHAAIKPATAVHAGQTVCENCHKSTSTWAGAKVDHSTFTVATNCASCHNGSGATGKSATHIPVAATNCTACHNTTAWKPSSWNHTQLTVTNQCASCHTGAFPPADGKPSTHTPYQSVASLAAANCDSCHKAGYAAWTPAKLHASVTVTAQCATCHAATKPATAVHTGQTVCENCHKSTSTWAGAKVDHSTFTVATNCASCHNGSGATGKSATHIPVAATNCFACHNTTAWKPTKWNHTQVVVVNQCASCHTGTYPPADGKPATHVPYQLVATLAAANCDSCHKAGYVAWAPGKVHTSVTVTAQCATCHASIKPATAVHTGQTVCENCHKSTSTWAGAKVDHSTFTVATNCASCHNGSGATGKSATHIPVAATNCFACHNTTAWKPTKWNHTQVVVVNQCASCHTGTYPPADGKPATHVPYQLVATLAAANCDSCHKAGYVAWAGGMLHANVTVTAQCATCHASIKPATAVHTGQTVCENCHKSTTAWQGAKVDHSTFTVATNCASCHNGSGATGKSATHIPVAATNCFACHNTTAWKPTKWNHTQVVVVNQCASCHTGTYPPADGKPATHVPYQLVATLAAANCDSCHKAGYVAWAGGKLHANVTVTAQCATCHASIKPATAVHTGQTVCENCHKSTTAWQGAKVDHSTFTVATNCASCHNGTGATGKSATHIPVAATNCFACHNTTAWKPTKWNHTQVPVLDCASCHSGSYPPADGRPALHIPYQTITGLAAVNCSTCHKAGYASWAGGKLHTSVTVSTQCKTCHGGTYTSQGAVTKPVNHIPENQLLNGAAMECNACHTATTVWTTLRMNHNASMGSGAGWCKSCHATGTSYLGNMSRKAITHQTKTPVPADCSTSGCHRPLGSRGTAYSSWGG